MLTLYYKTGCQYCAKVLAAGEDLKLSFVKKNIADECVMDELIERGGQEQVPYLVDDEGPVEMYESDAIVQYLHHTFGNTGVELSEKEAIGTNVIPGTCTTSDE